LLPASRPQSLFDAFPDNPDDRLADGANNLFVSLSTAVATRRPHVMAIQRYDVRDAAGHFVERYWRPVNTPVFSPSGRLVFLLHRVEDVTGEMQAHLRPPPHDVGGRAAA